MSTVTERELPTEAIDVFVPDESAVYPLDVAARLAQTSRRLVMVYCKHGLVHPTQDEATGSYYFGGREIRHLQRVTFLHEQCGINFTGVRLIIELAEQVARSRRPD
jgi:DNA-binding transcriptional MerR regulator